MTTSRSPLTPQTIAALWRPRDARLSADGRRVAWEAAPFGRDAEHGESGIWVASLDEVGPPRRWTHGADDTEPRWSPDGDRLAFLSDRRERGTAGLYVLDADGGEATPLVVRKRSVEAHAWSPDGRRIAFLAPDEPTEDDERREEQRDDADVYGERWRYHRLWLVDVSGDDGAEPVMRWAPDMHLTDLTWSPDGARIGLAVQDTPQADARIQTSVWVVSADGTDGGTWLCAASGADGLTWPTPRVISWVGPHDPSPQTGHTVWACEVGADASRPRVVGTGRDEPRCAVEAQAVPGHDRLVISVLDGLDTRLEWCDPASGERSPLWDCPNDVDAWSVAIGPKGPVIAAVTCGDDRASEVWTGPSDRLTRRSDHGAVLVGAELGVVSDLTCTAVDGEDLDAVVIRRADAAPGPDRTVVLIHGGPYGRSGREAHLHPLDWGQLLASAGYTVLMPNYRGGIGHGRARAASVCGDMGGAEWQDVVSIVDAAVERGIADPDRLGIGGWSQGGFLTAWAVTQTDRFKAAVMGAGVSDWGMMAATSDLPTFEAVLGGSRPWDGPGPHAAAARSPISYAARRTTPLLIVHGQEDERVPVSQAVAFHRALAGQDAPVELVTYPREPHGIGERRHQEDVMRRVLAWYDRFM